MTTPVDVYLNRDDLSMLFQDLAITMLGLDQARSKWEAANSEFDSSTVEGRSTWDDTDIVDNPFYLVRIGWENSPAQKYGEDICYIRVATVDNPYTTQRHVQIEELDEVKVNVKITRTRVIGVFFTFMGPNAYDHAEKVNDGIFHPDVKRALGQNKVYVIPGFASPRRAPELFSGNWWERADLSIQFNNLIVRNYPANFLTAAGIEIENEGGTVASLSMEELRKLAAFEDTEENAWESSAGSGFENPS